MLCGEIDELSKNMDKEDEFSDLNYVLETLTQKEKEIMYGRTGGGYAPVVGRIMSHTAFPARMYMGISPGTIRICRTGNQFPYSECYVFHVAKIGRIMQ